MKLNLWQKFWKLSKSGHVFAGLHLLWLSLCIQYRSLRILFRRFWRLCAKRLLFRDIWHCIRSHIPTELPLKGLLWNLILHTCMKICWKRPKFVYNWTNYRSLYVKTSVRLLLFTATQSRNEIHLFQVFMSSDRYFCPILTKLGFSQLMFIKISNIRFYRNRSSGSRFDRCG